MKKCVCECLCVYSTVFTELKDIEMHFMSVSKQFRNNILYSSLSNKKKSPGKECFRSSRMRSDMEKT